MPISLVKADSLLAIDVGAVHTRAALFDVVDARYRYLASGVAPTTAYAPFNDISEGIRSALDRLQLITGRILIDAEEKLITPERVDGAGVDNVVATLSVGPPIKIVAVGLLEDVSLESAVNLAATTYSKLVLRMGMTDRRGIGERINLIHRLKPDLIILAGGTEGGAAQSVMKMLEAIGLACLLMPEELRPEILFVGNKSIRDEVQSSLGVVGSLHVSPNIRPGLDVEQLEPAQLELSSTLTRIRKKHLPGVFELDSWTNGGLLPTAFAFSRVVRSLSKIYQSNKGVLGLDLGASALTFAAGFKGNVELGVYPQLGLGAGLSRLLSEKSLGRQLSVREITRWCKLSTSEQTVQEYLLTKSTYPGSIPATEEELDIEQALARQLVRYAMELFLPRIRFASQASSLTLLPQLEPIIISGSIFTRAPRMSQAVLMLLDGLQPTGVSTLVLDQNHLTTAIGAASALNPIMAVQVLDYGAFLNLGTVVSPVGQARLGTVILKVVMEKEDGQKTEIQVRQGDLIHLSLALGQVAQVHLQPMHRFDIGMGGPGQGGRVRAVGGVLGLIIDARGRPLRLPKEHSQRKEQLLKWQAILDR